MREKNVYAKLNEVFDYESFSRKELREFGYTLNKVLKR